MFQPKELFIGLRYIRAKRKSHFVSFIAFISIGGVALRVCEKKTIQFPMHNIQYVTHMIYAMRLHNTNQHVIILSDSQS